jgi:ATP-dependent DNA helicase RecQ
VNVNSSLAHALKTYWGFDDFLPLQREAMQCVLDDRDSVVVMPTGGGKSLCYQAPAMCKGGLAVVVSPLIALMKDQVDALRTCGIAAAAANSSLSADEKRTVAREIEAGRLRLLYTSPERLLAEKTLQFLQSQRVSFFAIDEAHCISAWGHDFRPEYRDLKRLRERFPDAALHAYTATATGQVRDDIAQQLGLRDPEILVGDFRRKNLLYHVARRERGLNQVCSVLDRFRGQSGIVYCIKRASVEKTCKLLRELGYKAAPYHAGMTDDDRTRNQDAFLSESVDTIVATIAFGMGIDKSNVRYVVHAGMPKSLEHYQQESGRAGRDGEPAECWLLYSAADLMAWRRIMDQMQGEPRAAAEAALVRMYEYCSSVTCRHASLIGHFGQAWNEGPCDACDVCLGKLDVVDDPLAIAQKILSCVVRVREDFAAGYVAKVLTGSREQRILQWGHDKLSTWGILDEFRRQDVAQWIEQLVGQGFMEKQGEYQVLHLTDAGHQLLKGNGSPVLLVASKQHILATPTSILDSWEGVDRGLFDELRKLRQREAVARSVPAYVVFGDAALRDMARRRPSTVQRFLDVHGVGQKKAADFGARFVECIVNYCGRQELPLDAEPDLEQRRPQREMKAATPTAGAIQSFELFDQGMTVEEVAERLQRAISTTCGYLEAYIQHRRVADASRWVPPHELQQVEVVVQYAGAERLKPIYEALHGRVDYDKIRIAIACLANRAGSTDRSALPAQCDISLPFARRLDLTAFNSCEDD